VASWSSLDYFGRWKALHYAARRFYAPLLLSVEDDGTSLEIYVSSDLVETWEGIVAWSLETLSGKVIESGRESVTSQPLANIMVKSLDMSEHLSADNEREIVFVYQLHKDGEIFLYLRTAFCADQTSFTGRTKSEVSSSQ